MPVFFSGRSVLLIPLSLVLMLLIHVPSQAQNNVPLPDAGELSTVDQEEGGEEFYEDDVNSIAAPSARKQEISDDFFDAESLAPQGEMSKSGPVKVNPGALSARKLIVVKKNYEADTKTARLVSAERALKLGRFESAIEMFDSLYEINKNDARVLMGRAVALQRLQRFDEAMQMYEALEKIEPDNLDVKVNMLGLLSTRFPAIALRRLTALYQNNKNHIGVVSQLALVHARVGDIASALRYMGIAASMEPKNANHIFNMAVIVDRAGNTDQAIKYYEQALETDTIYGGGRTIPREVVYERLAKIR